MRLYMVRHGQSETNLAKKYTGWAQVSLTEKGFADARRAGQFLEGLHFDRIYSSDLLRAVQTAQTAIPGCEPIQLPDLREINVGSLAYRSIVECRETMGEEFLHNLAIHNFVPYGGEDVDMLRERIARFLHMLEEEPCDQVIAFAHAGALQAALDYVLDQHIVRSHLSCMNGSIAVFVYENNRWYLESWGLNIG